MQERAQSKMLMKMLVGAMPGSRQRKLLTEIRTKKAISIEKLSGNLDLRALPIAH